jgi:hypothetical protein
MTSTNGEISARLRSVTDQLRDLERDLKSEKQPDAQLVQNFRDALDSSRMTAWTITELLHARKTNPNPQAALPFLFAERIRRFTQMTNDLCADIDNQNIRLQSHGIDALSGALDLLQSQLSRLAK